MLDYSRYYILAAFLVGVALTAAYKEQSSENQAENAGSKEKIKGPQKLGYKSISTYSNVVKDKLAESGISTGTGAGNIKEGIEGCIGNTPLIKIKSLSDYTGCEILAKAEVDLTIIGSFDDVDDVDVH